VHIGELAPAVLASTLKSARRLRRMQVEIRNLHREKGMNQHIDAAKKK
jgi:hypothetical protein